MVKMEKESKYYIDSYRTSCPVSLFKSINIPTQYLVEDSGEVIQEFKNKALKINYKNSFIYMTVKTWKFKNSEGSNLIILYSAKAADNYRTGIKLKTHINILRFLRNIKLIDFKNKDLDRIIKATYIKDLDIKIDMVHGQVKDFERKDKKKNNSINQYRHIFKVYRERYEANYPNPQINRGVKIYDTTKGFMLQVNRREGSDYKHPFYKIYDKSLEMRKKEAEFLNTLSGEEIAYFLGNEIFREEFTIRNKRDFEHYGLPIYLDQIFNIDFNKWHEVAQSIKNQLFKEIEVPERKRLNLSPLDSYILKLMEKYIFQSKKLTANQKEPYKNYFNTIEFVEMVDEITELSPVAKSRLRNKINEIIFNL